MNKIGSRKLFRPNKDAAECIQIIEKVDWENASHLTEIIQHYKTKSTAPFYAQSGVHRMMLSSHTKSYLVILIRHCALNNLSQFLLF